MFINKIIYTCFFGEGNGDPLHYSCLENLMDRGAWWAAVHGVAKSWTRLSDFLLSCIEEGNGNPLQCSCLENPRDGGAWWAAIYGVAESRTRLKRLSSSSSMIVFQIPHICVKIHLFFPFWLSSLWKQPICPSTGAWIKKVWYIHKVEYYSVIKRNQIQSFVQMRMDPDAPPVFLIISL